MRMENKHGLTFQLAYTYSHEIDTATNDLNAVANPFDISYDRASGGFDRRQIFNANYIYQLPFFAKSGNAFERVVLGGWEVSGVTVVQSGIPQSITYNGADILGLGGGTTNRPNIVGTISYPKTRLAWFNKSAFASSSRLLGTGAESRLWQCQKGCNHPSGTLQLQLWPRSRPSRSRKT